LSIVISAFKHLFLTRLPVFEPLSPNNIITSAVAADLASHPSVRGSSKSLGTVTGLINGCGAITASLGLMAVGPLQAAFGWSSVWVYLIACTACGTALMGTKIYGELFPTAVASAVVV
jgi:MFS transporter, OPA family, solute carrier family 37 (glycerol-3-phosphate transporter), member 1/2